MSELIGIGLGLAFIGAAGLAILVFIAFRLHDIYKILNDRLAGD